MDEAMNELAFVATGIYGRPLPKQNGAPWRLALPWKYGYKSAKGVTRIEFVTEEPETFWSAVRPEAYGFYSNVNPDVPHPNWSQAHELPVPARSQSERIPTQVYNGIWGVGGGPLRPGAPYVPELAATSRAQSAAVDAGAFQQRG